MACTTSPAALDRLNRDLGFQPLSHWLGRAEMFLGLICMSVGVFGMLCVAPEVVRQITGGKQAVQFDPPYWAVIGSFLAFVLGGYLALSGHRRHLYESADRLTAYLADLIRPAAAADTAPAAAADTAPVAAHTTAPAREVVPVGSNGVPTIPITA